MPDSKPQREFPPRPAHFTSGQSLFAVKPPAIGERQAAAQHLVPPAQESVSRIEFPLSSTMGGGISVENWAKFVGYIVVRGGTAAWVGDI